MYLLEFEGSPRKVGRSLSVIAYFEAPVRYWNALGKSLSEAKHYPLDVRQASATAVYQAARELAEVSCMEEKAALSAASDMVRFNLPNTEMENVVVLPSKDRPGDLAVSATIHPSRLPFLAASLGNEGLKFTAIPMEDEAPLDTNKDIFA